ncbi:hypothetical protein EWM64_g7058 [Hericium alpestre]|uniref:Hemerythrin-like domain-containing protein n=1 Tax=Hericium alpestre TaxID=135208 RepID=A0A4Y9ZRQ5_9AGAM|nr:hypothetical protein EWM64_g7058 [Hericium alpestre]
MSLLDTATEIRIDHDNVRELFERYQSASSKDEKAVIANTLVREMAIHGDAEEISVYNELPRLGLGPTVEHNKEEHAEIKRLVYSADSTPTDSENYDEVVTHAVQTFIQHAEEEEIDQLPVIKKKVSEEDNDKMARSFLYARKVVPTRPHPMAPQTGGIAQKAAGLPAALHDKIVETINTRKFVDVKQQHPNV